MRRFLLAYLLTTLAVAAQPAPKGYVVAQQSASPDGRLAVIIPAGIGDSAENLRNAIIETKSGQELGTIQQDEVACERMNASEILPVRWSADGSAMLWLVDDKWGMQSISLVTFKDDKVLLQVDVLVALQREILKRTRAADPAKYEKAKTENKGYGSWFKDGFATDAVLFESGEALNFPLRFRVFLTSDTKSVPNMTRVDSRMTATVQNDGKVKVEKFYLGTQPPARDWIRPEQLPKE